MPCVSDTPATARVRATRRKGLFLLVALTPAVAGVSLTQGTRLFQRCHRRAQTRNREGLPFSAAVFLTVIGTTEEIARTIASGATLPLSCCLAHRIPPTE